MLIQHELSAKQLVPGPAHKCPEHISVDLPEGKRLRGRNALPADRPAYRDEFPLVLRALSCPGTILLPELVGSEHNNVVPVPDSQVIRLLQHVRLKKVVRIEEGEIFSLRQVHAAVPSRAGPGIFLTHDLHSRVLRGILAQNDG